MEPDIKTEDPDTPVDEFWDAIYRMRFQEVTVLCHGILAVMHDRGWTLNTTEAPVEGAELADVLTAVAENRKP